jgi:hypothetical protein
MALGPSATKAEKLTQHRQLLPDGAATFDGGSRCFPDVSSSGMLLAQQGATIDFTAAEESGQIGVP